MEDKSFLGRGWSFPPDFQNDKRTTRMSEYEEDIRQSLIILFSTRVGERFTEIMDVTWQILFLNRLQVRL